MAAPGARAPPFNPFAWAHEHYAEVAWLSQNTNHLFPSAPIEEALARTIREHRYQSYPFAPGNQRLKELIGAEYMVPAEQTGITSGGTEALYMLTRALLAPGDEVIASDPSYLIIHKFIELSGAKTVNLDIYEPPYRLTPERVQAAITPKTRMILLIDPLNPLGSGYPKEDVRAIAEIAKDHKLFLLNDTTYRDFAEHHTLARPYHPDGTVCVWSVSKNCGLAGLRLGGLCASKELFDRIWKYNTNDLGVNVLSQAAALAAYEVKDRYMPQIVAQTRENQRRIHEAAAKWPGVTVPVYPSQANMFVLDVSALGVDIEDVQFTLLRDHKVFVRAGTYLSPKFGKRFLRVSFSNPASDIDRFLQAFPQALAKASETARQRKLLTTPAAA